MRFYKLLKEYGVGFFILMVAFSYSVSQVLQFALGLGEEASMLKQFSAAILFLSMLWGIRRIGEFGNKIRPILLFVLCLCLYGLSYLLYGDKGFNDRYWSNYLSMIVRMGPAVIVGILIANRQRYLILAEKSLWIFTLLYTFVIFFVVRTSAANDILFYRYGGFSYQSLSYYASYAYGFTLFLLTSQKKVESFNKPLWYSLFPLALLQIYLVIAPGGRGAFVLMGLFTVYFGLKELSVTKITLITLILFASSAVFETFMSNDAFSGGFGRVSNFFFGSDSFEDEAREYLYSRALDYWMQSPVWGYGIGSIWFTVGFYSHNMFMDLLVEGGIVLFFIYLRTLYRFYKKIRFLLTINYRYEILIVIFICSFVHMLFSGYYLSDSGTWFVITAVLMYDIDNTTKEVVKG